jgi:hypothetical protein
MRYYHFHHSQPHIGLRHYLFLDFMDIQILDPITRDLNLNPPCAPLLCLFDSSDLGRKRPLDQIIYPAPIIHIHPCFFALSCAAFALYFIKNSTPRNKKKKKKSSLKS